MLRIPGSETALSMTGIQGIDVKFENESQVMYSRN